MNTGATVLIIARPGSLRDGLQALLESVSLVQSLGVVGDEAAALSWIAQHRPGIILFEPYSAVHPIWPAILEFKHVFPRMKCVLLTESVNPPDAGEVDAVVLQGTPPDELVALIEQMLAKILDEEK